MDSACRDKVEVLMRESERKAIGRISQKELKPSLLILFLFRHFIIQNRGGPSSEGAIKSRIQELIAENTSPPIGRFHCTDFSNDSFIRDIDREFILKLKTEA